MTFKNSLLGGTRRFAAGIDVTEQAVRLVVVSQRPRGIGRLRLEHQASVRLTAGAMAGAEIIDRHGVTCALRDVFADLPRACSTQALCCAMALPAAVTLTTTLPLTRLVAMSGCGGDGGRELVAVEPAVMSEAERMAGIERHALAVDWFIDDASPGSRSVTIAATARQHLEARIECAATAGISLIAIDGELHAALRAMRFAAYYELDPHEPYLAIWIGPDGAYGWRTVEGAIDGEMRYPAPEHSDFADALRYLTGGVALDCSLIAGDLDLLDGVGFTLADVADVLGCAVVPFATFALGELARPLPDALLHDAANAVAFGLALRGVME